MTEIQFMNKIAEYESYYERTLEPDMIDGYKSRYMKLDYELFTGMLEHIKDNFKPSYSKKYPNYVDFNAAKSIVQTKLNAAKKPEQVKEKYMSHEAFKIFRQLLDEINLWYGLGIYWKVNGELKPLQRRQYQTPIDMDQWIEMDCPPLNCVIFDYIQRKSIPYYKKLKATGDDKPLDEYYKGVLIWLQKTRKLRIKNGEHRK